MYAPPVSLAVADMVAVAPAQMVALVAVMVGTGFTVTTEDCDAIQPLFVYVTIYVVVEDGATVIFAPVALFDQV